MCCVIIICTLDCNAVFSHKRRIYTEDFTMAVFETVMGILLIIMAVFLVVAVLMQHGKDHHLSGTIAGGAENFFGKTKGKKIDKTLGHLTTVISIIFVVCLIVLYIIQPNVVYTADNPQTVPGANSPYYDGEIVNPAETTAATDTAEAPADTSEVTE